MRTRGQLVADLEASGLRFCTFTLEQTWPDARADVEWNQRDLAHIPFIHGGFRFHTAGVDDERASGIYLQRVLGVRLPLAVSFVQSSPSTRLYQTALGPILLLIESELTGLGEQTHEATTYSIGAPRWLSLLLPAIERLLRKNAARLAREDAALRTRRRELRGWGYRFAADTEGASYRRSLDLSRTNVVAPPLESAPASLDLDDGACQWRIGRDDHLGLRVIKDGRSVSVFPRLCLHEGASLDACAPESGRLRCPWHGRTILPLVTFTLEPGNRHYQTPHHRLILDGSALIVQPLNA